MATFPDPRASSPPPAPPLSRAPACSQLSMLVQILKSRPSGGAGCPGKKYSRTWLSKRP